MRVFQRAALRRTPCRFSARALGWSPRLLTGISRSSLPIYSPAKYNTYRNESTASTSTSGEVEAGDIRDDIHALEADARALVADESRGRDPHELARILSRLSEHSALPQASAVLALVGPYVSSCTDFSARDIAMALHGVNAFGIDAPGMSGILSAMCRHISACRDAFTARDLAMSLYGLRSCKGTVCEEPLRAILKALAPQIERSGEQMKSQEIGMALTGLQSCRSEHAETCAVLSALAPQIEHCLEPLDAQAVGTALYGLRSCSSAHAETRAVLSALAPQIERCTTPLSAKCVAMAHSGLRSCSSDHAEVRAVRTAMARLQSSTR